MTSQPEPQSPLRVVPPNSDRPNQPPAPPQPPTPDSTSTAQPEPPRRGWLRVGAVVMTFGALGFIPMNNYVGADATVKTREQHRQLLTMPNDGRTEFHVSYGDQVQIEDPLVTIYNDQLDDRIRELQRNIQQKEGELQRSQIELERIERRFQSARDEERQAQRRLDRHNRDLQELTTGSGLPGSRRIDQDRNSIESEIAGVGDQIRNLEAQIQGLQTRRNTIETTLARLADDLEIVKVQENDLQDLAKERGLSRNDLNNMRRDRSRLEREIDEKQGEYDEIGSEIRQLQHDIHQQENHAQGQHHQTESLEEQQQDLIRQFQQERQDLQADSERQQNNRRTLEPEVDSALSAVSDQQAALTALKQELDVLQNRQTSLTETATVAGTILTEDLDLQNNQTVTRGEEILSLANLNTYQGVAEIPQGDRRLIEEGQPLEFRMENQANIRYRATVENISHGYTEGQNGLQPVLHVTFTIDNEEAITLLEAQGYVNIQTENRNLYQQIGHEFGKLIDLPRYFPWLSGKST